MFDLSSYVACIAEGGAETAILELLLDHHLLIFERDMQAKQKASEMVRCFLFCP